MDPQEPEKYCTCSALGGHGDEHMPTCLLYTPISAMDIPIRSSRASISSSSGARPPSYSGYSFGGSFLSGSNAYSHYPQPSNVSSVAASYASTSSMMDSTAATEIESLSSYPFKRSMSTCSFSSTASGFYMLPTELFRQVFKYLDTEDLKTVVQVSRQWRSAANSLLWRSVVFPLDKRRLAAMKPVLAHFGYLVRRVVITPPLLEAHYSQSSSSRRVSMSSNANNAANNNSGVNGGSGRSWSLSRPLSRSGSISSNQQQPLPVSNAQSAPFSSFAEPGSPAALSLSASATNQAAAAAADLLPPATASFGTIHSGFTSVASSPQNHPANTSHFPPPSPLSLASSSRPRASLSTTADASVPATPASSMGVSVGRQQSRTSASAASPSPSLPPIYAVPIPGNPGPGNVLSESRPPSVADSSWSATAAGLGAINISSASGGAPSGNSTSSRANNNNNNNSNSSSMHPGSYHPYSQSSKPYHHHHHEVSEGTVLRMHQFMERFCPNVLEAVIKNTAGISSHSRRLGILVRLFQAYPRLEKLDLSDFIMWDPQPLQLVSEHLHMLSSLDVTNRVELTDVDLLPVVENCHRLRELKIRATNATDSTIYAIVGNLAHSLVSLNVGGCPVSSSAMAELVTKCAKLRVLHMWSCLRLDDTFLLALNPQFLTSFQVLDMMDVQKFSSDAVRRTFGQQVWPHLRYLRIRAKCTRDDFSGIPVFATLKLNSNTILD
ncbi:hypothetical protein FB639_004086 [Coemansia asiatica]|nr:hypothetical protein FB639_004086 [Coemansia asiatica]